MAATRKNNLWFEGRIKVRGRRKPAPSVFWIAAKTFVRRQYSKENSSNSTPRPNNPHPTSSDLYMKKLLLFSAMLVGAATASQAHAGGLNVHLGFNLPLPPLPGLVVTHAAPVYTPAPVVSAPVPCEPAPVYDSSATCEQPVVTTAPVCPPTLAPVVVAPAPVCPPQIVVAPRPVIVQRSAPVIVERPRYERRDVRYAWNSYDHRRDGRDSRHDSLGHRR